jgi:hypothetical protein
MMGIIYIMKKPSFNPALTSKPRMPRSLGEASEAIRLLQETITTLTEQARQLEATQNAGSNARALKKIRGKK